MKHIKCCPMEILHILKKKFCPGIASGGMLCLRCYDHHHGHMGKHWWMKSRWTGRYTYYYSSAKDKQRLIYCWVDSWHTACFLTILCSETWSDSEMEQIRQLFMFYLVWCCYFNLCTGVTVMVYISFEYRVMSCFNKCEHKVHITWSLCAKTVRPKISSQSGTVDSATSYNIAHHPWSYNSSKSHPRHCKKL